MNIVNRLTLRCLKLNKRRTMVTVIGIALSVTMLTAISTILFSFMDTMQRDEIAKHGEWHAAISGVDASKLDQIEQVENVEAVLLTRNVGFVQFRESTHPDKLFLYIEEYNTPAFSYLNKKLAQGRLPQRAGEAVIGKAALASGADYQIGDTVTFQTGYRVGDPGRTGNEMRLSTGDYPVRDRKGNLDETFEPREKRTYTITGILEESDVYDGLAAAFSVIGYCDAASLAAEGITANPKLVFDPVRRSLYQEVETLAQQTGAKGQSFNGELLQYYGLTSRDSLQMTIYFFMGILMLIVLIGSAMLIYNAFSISVAERSQYLGMLASVGATKRQKRNSVYFEGFLLGLVAIPPGLLAGIGGIGVTFLLMNTAMRDALGLIVDVRVIVSPASLLLAVVLSALVIFLSVWKPAWRASHTMPIDAIRQTREVKLSKKTVKTSRATRKLFGFEGEIALKNLKRNRSRYRTTVVSLSVSVVLFLTVSFGIQLANQIFCMEQGQIPCDIIVFSVGMEPAKREEIFDRVLREGKVTDHTVYDSMTFLSSMNKEDIDKDYLTQAQLTEQNGSYHVPVSLYILDDASFAAYAREVGVKTADYDDPNKRKAILINENTWDIINEETNVKTVKTFRLLNLRRGEALTMQQVTSEDGSQITTSGTMEIAHITAEKPFGIDTFGPSLVVPEKTGSAIAAEYAEKMAGPDKPIRLECEPVLCLNSDSPARVRDILDSYNEPGLSEQVRYNDYAIQREEQEHVLLLISVFSGGFIALITLICLANLFNTISTSVALRRREFAMIKSAGMTPKGFRKMIRYESLFYALKTLLYGLPVSFGLMALLQLVVQEDFEMPFRVPWIPLVCAVAGVVVFVGLTMLYSSGKLKKNNIIEALKDENF